MEIPIEREGPRNLVAEASAGYLLTVHEAARDTPATNSFAADSSLTFASVGLSVCRGMR